MKVYLVRHGSYNNPAKDPEKHLSMVGKEDVIELGKYLYENSHIPVSIFHSGIIRAHETANLLATELKLDTPKEIENLKPSSPVQYWGDKLNDMEEDVMFVGHMPYMSILVEYLTNNEVIHSFEPPEVICLERQSKGIWKMLWSKTTF